jgi:hypothetical protein
MASQMVNLPKHGEIDGVPFYRLEATAEELEEASKVEGKTPPAHPEGLAYYYHGNRFTTTDPTGRGYWYMWSDAKGQDACGTTNYWSFPPAKTRQYSVDHIDPCPGSGYWRVEVIWGN